MEVLFLFKSKSQRNLVTMVATKPDLLVPKDKLLVALVIVSVKLTSPAVQVVDRGRFIGDEY